MLYFFFSSRRRHTRWTGDWSSDVCSSDLDEGENGEIEVAHRCQIYRVVTDQIAIGPGTNQDSRPSLHATMLAFLIRLHRLPAAIHTYNRRMHFPKIPLAIAAAAVASALACTGTHEVSARSGTPDLHAAPIPVGGPGDTIITSSSTPARVPADTDTTVRPTVAG